MEVNIPIPPPPHAYIFPGVAPAFPPTPVPASAPSSTTISVAPPSYPLIVVDNGMKRLQFLDLTSRQVHDSIDLGDGKWVGLSFHRPHPSSEDMLLSVSDFLTHSVKVFDIKTKSVVRSIGRGGAGTALGQLYGPHFICMYYPSDAGASLLVSNSSNNRIDMFDFESGTYIRSIGSGPGAMPGQLHEPGSIAVWIPQDDLINAQVVVADSENHRLQFFRLSDGVYVRSVGEAGTGPGQLDCPWAMSIHMPVGGRDEDALLVTIGMYDARIHVYGVVSGEYLRCMGGGVGGGVDQLAEYVYGIAFHRPADEDEGATLVITSDNGNHRLQMFNLYTGAHVCSIGGGDSSHPHCMVLPSRDGDEWDYVLK